MSSTNREASRIAVIDAAVAVVDRRLGVIEGCRRLSSLAYDLVADPRVDEDFVVFVAVDSETDALPTGSARQHWDPDALRREDAEIARTEAKYKDQVLSACRNVVARFKGAQF